MAYASKLMNPTPFDVEINYEKGVNLNIPAFGSVDLTLQQLDDYRPDKPGSETVAEITEPFGLFLLDTDRPYEHQALDSLRVCRRRKDDLYRVATQGHRDRAARQNLTITEETFKHIEDLMGMTMIKEQIAKLDKLIKKYEEVVKGTTESRKRRQFDPSRTIFALNPPKEFDSVITRQFFLDENPAIAEKEAAIRESMEKASA
jgi:hypothetical protein